MTVSPKGDTPLAKTKRRLLKLSDDLERAILYGLMGGAVPRDVVEPEELSRLGRVVLGVLDNMLEGGSKPPFTPAAVLLTATEVLGVSKDSLKNYLRLMEEENVGSEATAVLQKVRDKQLMVDVLNETTLQIQKGVLDVGAITALCNERRVEDTNGLVSLSETLRDGLPDPPVGLDLASLPTICRATGGLIGMWAIAGQPAVGKSALAWQCVVDVGRTIPVLVYDFENGYAVLMDRLRNVFKGNLERIREALTRVYIRESIHTLDRDLLAIPPPALVVVDSVQKLPASGIGDKRAGLDRWVQRLESLKKRGYFILLVSEVARSQYEAGAYIGSFKETGEIEYSADAGMQLLPVGESDVEVHIVKNRHRPHRGLVTVLQRHNNWWFKETGGRRFEDQDLPSLRNLTEWD